jgi:hypothetical protein
MSRIILNKPKDELPASITNALRYRPDNSTIPESIKDGLTLLHDYAGVHDSISLNLTKFMGTIHRRY